MTDRIVLTNLQVDGVGGVHAEAHATRQHQRQHSGRSEFRHGCDKGLLAAIRL